MSNFRPLRLFALFVPLFVLVWFHAAASNQSVASVPAAARAGYDIGTPTLSDLWVNPVSGSDSASGATRAQALRTIGAAWNRIPRGTTLNTTGYRILLVAGDYPDTNFPVYWEQRYGTFNFPIILQSADAPRSARLLGNVNMYDTRYFYFLDVTIANAGDAFHCELCDHILIRNSALDGGARQAQETIKANQSRHIYIEDSDIAGAWDNAIDFVAVQYGAITRNRIHNANDWCAYTKGGSAYLRVEGNEIYDCGTGGYTAGQGTGFEFMTNPWLHYEAYDIKFVNNVVHDTEGACFGANGAYNALFAYNTCYRVGARSHVIEVVFGGHICDGDTARCNAHRAAGGWGEATQTDQPIPDRNVFIYNNLVYNPPGFSSQWQHFAIYGPRTPGAGTNIPSPARTDTNLQIRGNLIWNGSPDMPLGIGDTEGCRPSNPTCNETQLRADNTINVVQPQLVNPAGGNFHPTTGSNILSVTTFALPDFNWSDAPAPPSVPQGNLSNAVPIDRDGSARVGTAPPGAYAYASDGACLERPPAPTLVAPVSGARPNRRRVTLTWQTSTCATEYRVQVRQDRRRGASVAQAEGLTGLTFSTPRLARGHTYFWRVRACNAYGCTNSKWRSFTL